MSINPDAVYFRRPAGWQCHKLESYPPTIDSQLQLAIVRVSTVGQVVGRRKEGRKEGPNRSAKARRRRVGWGRQHPTGRERQGMCREVLWTCPKSGKISVSLQWPPSSHTNRLHQSVSISAPIPSHRTWQCYQVTSHQSATIKCCEEKQTPTPTLIWDHRVVVQILYIYIADL